MPAVQTSYATNLTPGTLGMVADGEWVTNVISRIVDPAATVAVNFGDPVLQGASEQTVVSANGATGTFRGIAVRDVTLPPTAGDAFGPTITLGVLTKGVIWVNAAVAVQAGQGRLRHRCRHSDRRRERRHRDPRRALGEQHGDAGSCETAARLNAAAAFVLERRRPAALGARDAHALIRRRYLRLFFS